MQDSLTIGIVLFLLIAALGVYIWLRFQQVETRLSLAESILLDMKMVTQAYSQFSSVSDDLDLTPVHAPAPVPAPASDVRNVTFTASSTMQSASVPIVNINKMDEVEPLTGLMTSDDTQMDFPSVLEELKKEMDTSSSAADITIHQASSSFSGPSNDYNGMTLKDLRALAKTRGIGGTGSMNRGQLIAVLQEREASAEPVEMEFDIANDTQE
jgi:hypothetical protein